MSRLTLPEELVILSYEEGRCLVLAPPLFASCLLSGALLELAWAGAAAVTAEAVVPAALPAELSALAPIVTALEASPPQSPEQWTRAYRLPAPHLRDTLRDNLIARGVLTKVPRRRLFIFPATGYAATDPSVRARLLERVRRTLLHPETVDLREQVRGALAESAYLCYRLFPVREELVHAKENARMLLRSLQADPAPDDEPRQPVAHVMRGLQRARDGYESDASAL